LTNASAVAASTSPTKRLTSRRVERAASTHAKNAIDADFAPPSLLGCQNLAQIDQAGFFFTLEYELQFEGSFNLAA
jgi:hypothetical protein